MMTSALSKPIATGLALALLALAIALAGWPLWLALWFFKTAGGHRIGLIFAFGVTVLSVLRQYQRLIARDAATVLIETEKGGTVFVINRAAPSVDPVNERLRRNFNTVCYDDDLAKPVTLLRSVENRNVNAFALRNRDSAAVIVFEALVMEVNDEELRAVLAHEVGHIRFDDTAARNRTVALECVLANAVRCANTVFGGIKSFRDEVARSVTQEEEKIPDLAIGTTLLGLRGVNAVATVLVGAHAVATSGLCVARKLASCAKAYAFRRDEFRADAYAAKQVGREATAAMIGKLPCDAHETSALAKWGRSHPSNDERIARLANEIYP